MFGKIASVLSPSPLTASPFLTETGETASPKIRIERIEPGAGNVGAPAAPISWRDLVPMSAWEKTWELFLPIPWLLGALYSYHMGFVAIGAVCSFYFFLTGLRQSHGAQHYALGFSKRFQDGVMFALSLSMLGSMHAVQTSHLHHHRHCLEKEDAEGWTARLDWWQAILVGPAFLFRLHWTAWRLATRRKRRWIAAEIFAICGVIAVGIAAPQLRPLRWHAAAMLVGECLTGFFAVWTVHRGCDSVETMARTQRGRWVNRLCYSMFYHAEHHLYPSVPTCHLEVLATRIDAAAPKVADKEVIAFEIFPREGRT